MKIIAVFLLIAAVTAGTINPEPILSEEDPIEEFVKGFLMGIGETKSIDDLMKCIKEIESIIANIQEAFILIKTMTIENIIKGINKLIEAVQNFTEMIKPCSTGYKVLEKLIIAIANTDISKIIQKLLNNITKILSIITSGIACIKDKEYRCIGKQIGALLKVLLLDEAEAEAFRFEK